MRRFVFCTLFVLFLAGPAAAHDGAIALFSDMAATDCDAVCLPGSAVELYLFYVRGEGPRSGNCFEFRLLSSSDGAILLDPVWPDNYVLHIGGIETGISVCHKYGTVADWCAPDEALVYIGAIPVMNAGDADSFTVTVVDDPTREWDPAILVIECAPGAPVYHVMGGTFVFNGYCSDALDPVGGPVGVRESTWGAIKGQLER